jgi:hypothetical protein
MVPQKKSMNASYMNTLKQEYLKRLNQCRDVLKHIKCLHFELSTDGQLTAGYLGFHNVSQMREYLARAGKSVQEPDLCGMYLTRAWFCCPLPVLYIWLIDHRNHRDD